MYRAGKYAACVLLTVFLNKIVFVQAHMVMQSTLKTVLWELRGFGENRDSVYLSEFYDVS